MHAVITVAFPVFGVIAAGLIAGRFGFLSGADAEALNRYVFRFAMPAALFGLAAGTPPPGAADLAIAASYAAAALTAIIGGYTVSQILFPLTKQEAGAHAFTSTLGNAVFLGLPIALSLDGWARPFIVLMLIEGIFVIGVGSALMAPRRHDGHALQRLAGYFSGPVKNPLVVGMAAGFIYSALGLGFSGPAETFFNLLGRAAGPTALFSLGLFLATHEFPPVRKVAGRASAIALAKMGVMPAVGLGVAALLGVSDPHYLGALALFLFVPSGVGSFIMASHYGVYQTEAASAVFLTTTLSVISVSTVLVLFA